ncbi:MAG TPA: hypothetical protein DF383_10725 [Deltaproteobacteria bacterium]|nr:hypothetical protein [Deltaproteobacteria bacterium]
MKEHEKQYIGKDRLKRIEEILGEVDAWKKANPAKARRLAKEDVAAQVRKMRDSRGSFQWIKKR